MPVRKRHLPAILVDFRSALPVYRQVILQVQKQASSGQLRPGDQLPTVRALALQLGVNFNTVARAYRWLHRLGVVSAQPGRGTFVQASPTSLQLKKLTLRALASQYVAEARRLHFSEAQIAAAFTERLAVPRPAGRAGDNHE
jgi:GntR family transcriptional regulator